MNRSPPFLNMLHHNLNAQATLDCPRFCISADVPDDREKLGDRVGSAGPCTTSELLDDLPAAKHGALVTGEELDVVGPRFCISADVPDDREKLGDIGTKVYLEDGIRPEVEAC
jgi:hypothetical protein